MTRPLVFAFCLLAALGGPLAAFEVRATLKSVDAGQGVVSFTAGEQERTARVDPDAKILDAKGEPLADGLKSGSLKAGAEVTLSVERVDNKPVIRAIRMGSNAPTSARPVAATAALEFQQVDTSNLTALTDLGTGKYQGFEGGLYPDGLNTRPASHEAAGLALARRVRPLDAAGKPADDGKIVLLGIGFSNTVQAFGGFMTVAKDDATINPRVVLVNGAVGGRSAEMVQQAETGKGAEYWSTVDERLRAAGVTRHQVQAVWIKETNPGPHSGSFPGYVQDLETQLGRIVRIVTTRFPNAKLAFLSSRTYGGWAKPRPNGAGPGNSEPYSYESGFAIKWLIERQLKGAPALNYDPARGPVKAPWLSWGPYLWANGTTPRNDGFRFELADFMETDQMHESPSGRLKIGKQILQFFETDPTTRSWFVKDQGK